ncbi:MAG: hypothetical protein M3R00_08690 [Pseudomonadota bacterium]|nr:hypothetical protein [Pseudomonadota bacterium]
MTIAEQLRQEAQYEAKLDTAKRSLAEGAEPVFGMKITGCHLQKFRRLRVKSFLSIF